MVEINNEEKIKFEISQCKFHMQNQIFTNRSLQEIKKYLAEEKKIIILQNKLGYFNNLKCKECGFVYTCENCSVNLTFHKKEKKFKCHYCGSNYEILKFCKNCGSENFYQSEMGIEKIFEFLNVLFPEKKILQIDSEILKNKKSKEKILEEIKCTDLIISTRVIENLNFEQVSLLILPDFDRLLTDSNFFTNEKIYKMLMKFKEITNEKIIIQTSIPEHTIFKNLNNYKSFYQTEIFDRKQYEYPPFSLLLKIECENKNENLLNKNVKKIIEDLQNLQVEILGSEKSKIFKIKNIFKMLIWIKINKNQKEIRDVLSKYKIKIFVL